MSDASSAPPISGQADTMRDGPGGDHTSATVCESAAQIPDESDVDLDLDARLHKARMLLRDPGVADTPTILEDTALLRLCVGPSAADTVDRTLWHSPMVEFPHMGVLWSTAVILYDIMTRTEACDQTVPVLYLRQTHTAPLRQNSTLRWHAKHLGLYWAEDESTPIPRGTHPWLQQVMEQLFAGKRYHGLMTFEPAQLPHVVRMALAQLAERGWMPPMDSMQELLEALVTHDHGDENTRLGSATGAPKVDHPLSMAELYSRHWAAMAAIDEALCADELRFAHGRFMTSDDAERIPTITFSACKSQALPEVLEALHECWEPSTQDLRFPLARALLREATVLWDSGLVNGSLTFEPSNVTVAEWEGVINVLFRKLGPSEASVADVTTESSERPFISVLREILCGRKRAVLPANPWLHHVMQQLSAGKRYGGLMMLESAEFRDAVTQLHTRLRSGASVDGDSQWRRLLDHLSATTMFQHFSDGEPVKPLRLLCEAVVDRHQSVSDLYDDEELCKVVAAVDEALSGAGLCFQIHFGKVGLFASPTRYVPSVGPATADDSRAAHHEDTFRAELNKALPLGIPHEIFYCSAAGVVEPGVLLCCVCAECSDKQPGKMVCPGRWYSLPDAETYTAVAVHLLGAADDSYRARAQFARELQFITTKTHTKIVAHAFDFEPPSQFRYRLVVVPFGEGSLSDVLPELNHTERFRVAQALLRVCEDWRNEGAAQGVDPTTIMYDIVDGQPALTLQRIPCDNGQSALWLPPDKPDKATTWEIDRWSVALILVDILEHGRFDEVDYWSKTDPLPVFYQFHQANSYWEAMELRSQWYSRFSRTASLLRDTHHNNTHMGTLQASRREAVRAVCFFIPRNQVYSPMELRSQWYEEASSSDACPEQSSPNPNEVCIPTDVIPVGMNPWLEQVMRRLLAGKRYVGLMTLESAEFRDAVTQLHTQLNGTSNGGEQWRHLLHHLSATTVFQDCQEDETLKPLRLLYEAVVDRHQSMSDLYDDEELCKVVAAVDEALSAAGLCIMRDSLGAMKLTQVSDGDAEFGV